MTDRIETPLGVLHPRYWIWLGIIAFNIAFWTGVWFGLRALAAVL